MVDAVRPDIVLTDLRMPEPSGGALIRLLLERVPTVRVLVLTTHDTDSDVLPAVEAGAIGYLLKDAPRRNCSVPSAPLLAARPCWRHRSQRCCCLACARAPG